jgi:hypothetical protein
MDLTVGMWTALIWLRISANEGCCKNNNKSSGSIKCREFIDELRNYWFFLERLLDGARF